jgi:hypothetical protein
MLDPVPTPEPLRRRPDDRDDGPPPPPPPRDRDDDTVTPEPAGSQTAPGAQQGDPTAGTPAGEPRGVPVGCLEDDDPGPSAADLEEFRRWRDGGDVEHESLALLTLDQMIDHEAYRYRGVGTLAAELIARHLAGLAEMVRFVRAATPHQAEDRIATMERDRLAEERELARRD